MSESVYASELHAGDWIACPEGQGTYCWIGTRNQRGDEMHFTIGRGPGHVHRDVVMSANEKVTLFLSLAGVAGRRKARRIMTTDLRSRCPSCHTHDTFTVHVRSGNHLVCPACKTSREGSPTVALTASPGPSRPSLVGRVRSWIPHVLTGTRSTPWRIP